jgi:hypothetical protein
MLCLFLVSALFFHYNAIKYVYAQSFHMVPNIIFVPWVPSYHVFSAMGASPFVVTMRCKGPVFLAPNISHVLQRHQVASQECVTVNGVLVESHCVVDLNKTSR